MTNKSNNKSEESKEVEDKHRKCFVIMPISDNEKYSPGHFGRVYEYIIKPACTLAGFIAVRADEVKTTNLIALDIVKQIIDSDMAICDLSSQNPNVLYEVGIRQAFDLPVTFIKDHATKRIFDIQGFRDVLYDETLRIDTVQKAIKDLSDVITNTYDNKTEVNSLVKLLGITAAQIADTTISQDTQLILDAIKSFSPNTNSETVQSSLIERSFGEYAVSVDYSKMPKDAVVLTVQDILKLKVGDYIYNKKYGNGRIISPFWQDGGVKRIKVKYSSTTINHVVAENRFFYSEMLDELF